MATVSGAPATFAIQPPGTRYDHVFFQVMVALLTVTMVVGFAKTYFLAGVFGAKLPNLLIHIHGAVFACWFLLLLIQSALASAHRVDLHRKLGIAGVVVACLMLPLGILATSEFLIRESAQRWILLAAVMPVAELGIFSVLAAAAFILRKQPAFHKRLILLATIGLMGAAVGRIQFLPFWQFHGVAAIRLVWAYTYVFIVLLAAYDLWSTRRVNRATVWGSVFIIAVQQAILMVWTTAPWHAFIGWMQSWRI
jgi:hypothetical protein